MNLQRHIHTLPQASVLAVYCPIFHNTRCNLLSAHGCLKERTGCSVDFATELLSCLRSIQRRSIMSIRRPRNIPRYKLRFQPQPRAKGIEVDATKNLLGAGMGLGMGSDNNLSFPTSSKVPLLDLL